MKNSKWLIVLSAVALLGFTACSDDDDPIVPDIPDLPTAALAEGAIEGSLNEVVEPVMWMRGLVTDFLGVKAGVSRGVTMMCPFIESDCQDGGTVACSESTSPIGLAFDFMTCGIPTDSGTLTIDGTAIAEWDGSVTYTFTLESGLTLNGTGIAGTMTISAFCNETSLDVVSSGTTAVGTIVDCDGGAEWPDAESHLQITTDVGFILQIVMTFNNTPTAMADVLLDGELIFDCTVGLEGPDATCIEV